MSYYRAFIFALGAAAGLTAGARQVPVSDVIRQLESAGDYSTGVRYEVLLASLSEPVSYDVALQAAPAPSDTLSPCDYFIDWTLHLPDGNSSEGFSAYFGGHHFRFRDSRLQEYHAAEDVMPFAPAGDAARGVQCQVQFAELLPRFMARRFAEMAADSTYIFTVTADTVYSGSPATVLKGVRRISGYDCAEYVYVLDNATMLPRHISLETNPGQIGEQSIAADYGTTVTPRLSAFTIDALTALESDAFGKYRESTFSLDNLPGRPLPRISAPALDGTRYDHAPGARFAAPTVLVFAETTVGSTPQLVADIRRALAAAPRQVDVVWAFLDQRPDDIEAVTGSAQPGETVLRHAGGAARDCGVGAVTPVLVFVNTDGTVSDFIRGYNRDIASDVITKATLCN